MANEKLDPARISSIASHIHFAYATCAVVLIGLGLIAGASVIYETSRYGIGLSPDSVAYIATATNIASQFRFVTDTGGYLVTQPPLYPFTLAVAKQLLGLDVLVAARIVGAVITGAIVIVSGLIAWRAFGPWWALLAAAATLVSVPIGLVSQMAWTEPLFIACICVFLWSLQQFVTAPRRLFYATLCTASALACVTRYLGVTLVVTGLLSLLWFTPRSSNKNTAYAIAFGFTSLAPLTMWSVRNYYLTGTWFGPRPTTIFSVTQNVNVAARTIAGWFMPRVIQGIDVGLLAGGVALGLAAGYFIARLAKVEPVAVPVTVLVIFTVTYLLTVLAASSVAAADEIDSRLLSPVAIPLGILSLGFVRRVAMNSSIILPRTLVAGLALLAIAASLVYQLNSTLQRISAGVEEGTGFYNGPALLTTDIAQYLRTHHLSSSLPAYSNDPEALYILTGVTSRDSPKRTEYNSPVVVVDLATLRGGWPSATALLVWFNGAHRDYLYKLDDLKTIAAVHPLAQLKDGGIYLVTRAIP